MRTALALAALLALPLSPLAAQGTTHLNVAPSQMVEVSFGQDPTASNWYIMQQLVRADGVSLGYSIPAGKLLILRDANAAFGVTSRSTSSLIYFRLTRGYGTGGSIWSYGEPMDTHLKVGASSVATDEKVRFDLPAGMAFTDVYRPRLGIFGPAYLVIGMKLSAWGYLVDLPAGKAAAPRGEAMAVPPTFER